MNPLSRREYFAGMAMQGIIMSPLGEDAEMMQIEDNATLMEIQAKTAVQIADALIRELDKPLSNDRSGAV